MAQPITKLAQRLSRITSSGRYIAEVDGLRFMAILPVLLQHLSERTQRYANVDWATPLASDPVAFWASRGTIGVFIFFAISGFILGLPFARYYQQAGKPVHLKSYFWRRITRLEPPYIFWMTCFFIILLIKSGGSNTELFAHWGASLVYLHNIIYADYSVINPVAWSLEIEIQFYILAPLLAFFFFRWQRVWLRRTLMVLGIFGVLLAQQFFGWVALPYKLTILWQLHYFLIGFLLADWYLHAGQQTVQSNNWWVDLIALVSIIVMGLTWSASLPKRMIFSVALLAFLFAGFRGLWFRRFLRLRWVAIIGGMCYTIYLIHLPLMEALVPFTSQITVGTQFGVNLLLQFLLVIPIVLIVSAAGFLLLEKPCMDKNWTKKLWAWLREDYLSWKT